MDKIVCVGKNYTEHAKELGEKQPENPVLFLKPPSVLKTAEAWGETIQAIFPEDPEVVPECELVLEMGKAGFDIPLEAAAGFIRSITVGLDMTLRDRQRTLKKNGHPWTTAKVFRDAAIVAPLVPVSTLFDWQALPFSLRDQSIVLQSATANDMIHSPIQLVCFVSQFFPICEGDLIFTGVPAGCTSIQKGKRLDIGLGERYCTVQW